MTRPNAPVVLAAVVVAFQLAACGSGGAPNAPPKHASSAATPACPKSPNFNASDFVSHVDNALFPLQPGTTYRYKGTDEGDPALDLVSVTHQTKRIMGVGTTVVRDRTYTNGKLAEDTRDWYAQDKGGTVWYFGEATKEWDKGHASTAGSWQAGVAGARAGIFMPARPAAGRVFNLSEDCGQVLDLKASVKTPHVSTDQAMRTKEWSPREGGDVFTKDYVRGVGLVRRALLGGNDFLELVSVEHHA
ncbi:MAG: hypothetical protein ACJ76S_02190 [Solirubrobacteraceae bacterium]|jgi:hypothetical protein